MSFIAENWSVIVLACIVIADIGAFIYHYFVQSPDARYEQVRGWLLQAVLMAEKEFGSGTGRLKLSSVYAEFCKQLPWLAKVISFQTFSEYVDDALDEMKNVLDGNGAIASIVEGA